MYSKPVVVPMRSKRTGVGDPQELDRRVAEKTRGAGRKAAREAKRAAMQAAHEELWFERMRNGYFVGGHRAER